MVSAPKWQLTVNKRDLLSAFRKEVLEKVPETSAGEVNIVLPGDDELQNQAIHNLFERASHNPSSGFEAASDVTVGQLEKKSSDQQSFALKYANKRSLISLHQTCIDRTQVSVMMHDIHKDERGR